MKVLYVEDDPRDADLTLRTLARNAPHLSVDTVASIEAALARLHETASTPIDLVLTDMHLRDGNGLLLLNHIRENSLPLAVVIVTGVGDEETAIAALKAHADDYVVKRKGYLERLPVTLESAFNHYRADAARRANPLKVLYLEANPYDIENTRRHLAIHADHISFDVATTPSEVFSTLRESPTHYDVVLMDFQFSDPNAQHVLRKLSLNSDQDTPVVLVCNEDNEALARQGVKIGGASSYLVKRPGYLYQLPWELEQAHARADLQRREAALHASEERNRAILNAMPDMMFLMNREGIYLDYHASNEADLLKPASEFIGKKYTEVLPPELAARFSWSFVRVYESEEPVRLEYTVTLSQGVRAFEASMVRCDGDKILAIVRDITQRKEAEQSLKKALDEVKSLKDQLHTENIYLQEEIRASNFGEIIGRSEPLRRVLRQAEQVAPLDTTVLISGETGTGKELLAHAIHKLSRRGNHALVKVNCAALPGTLIESELFGHEKGAFTGADARRIGRFEIANGGALFLDEVGELALDLQAKLLRVLEEGEFERVGGSHTVKVNVRVIAATNRNLEEAVRKGDFRSDLYYRLNIFPITMPPLRQRKEDIPMLVTHLVKQLSQKLGKNIDAIPQDTMAKLRNYPWPGNVRELRNVIERAVIISQGSKLRLIDDLDTQALELELHEQIAAQSAFADSIPSAETLEQTEYNVILRTLKNVHWKVEGPGGAAELLNIHPSTLRSKMRKLGIGRPRYTTNAI